MRRASAIGLAAGIAILVAWSIAPWLAYGATGVALLAFAPWWLVRRVGSAQLRDYRPTDAEQAQLVAFAGMTLNDVRRRAEDFERRAASVARRDAWIYAGAAQSWRKLEGELRRESKFAVDDLTEGQVRAWARRLDVIAPVAGSPLGDPHSAVPPASVPQATGDG